MVCEFMKDKNRWKENNKVEISKKEKKFIYDCIIIRMINNLELMKCIKDENDCIY